MEKLATAAASAVSRSRSLAQTPMAPISAAEASRAPVLYESSTDRDIPDRVVSYYIGDGKEQPILRREITADERAALEARVGHLSRALEPYPDAARRPLGAAIAGMLNGFPQMLRHGDNAALITAGYLATLREKPAWAILQVCERIRSGTAGGNLDFAPSEPRLNQMVAEAIAPYRARRDALLAVMAAPVHR